MFGLEDELREKIELFEELLSRVSIDNWCDILHHEESEYHKWNEECPVKKKFNEIINIENDF